MHAAPRVQSHSHRPPDRSAGLSRTTLQALGLPLATGHLHPLLKVRTQFRKIFTQMGFTEMPTNNYVESSFWNFDALFQPQQHPARDAHDTFFLSEPAATPTSSVPQHYLDRVKTVHESGGFGSIGCASSPFLHPALVEALRAPAPHRALPLRASAPCSPALPVAVQRRSGRAKRTAAVTPLPRPSGQDRISNRRAGPHLAQGRPS